MNPGVTFTDSTPDSAIQNNPQIDFNGPRINTNTLLVNVLQYSNGTYTNMFQPGTLTLTPRREGGNSMRKRLRSPIRPPCST